ncbi:MAG: chorismate mutase [Candidatus Latescibacterota bacterium]
MEMDLTTYRARIDSIDDIILELLNRRLKYALEINQIKVERGVQVMDASREQRIMERLRGYNEGPLSDEGMVKIFSTIIAESRRLMEESRSAVQAG